MEDHKLYSIFTIVVICICTIGIFVELDKKFHKFDSMKQPFIVKDTTKIDSLTKVILKKDKVIKQLNRELDEKYD